MPEVKKVIHRRYFTSYYDFFKLALRIWREIVYKTLKERIVHAVLQIFREARDGGTEFFEHGDLVASTVEIYIVLGLNKQDPLKLYREDLEIVFLKVR